MDVRSVVLLVLGLSVAAPGCAPADRNGGPAALGPPAEAGAVAETFQVPAAETGVLVLDGGALRFTPCGEDAVRVVDDVAGGSAAALIEEFGGQPLVVMLRLTDDRIVSVRYAGLEGPGCDRLPPDGDVQARGNEPFWSLAVDGAEARLTTPDRMEGVVFVDGAWQAEANGTWHYEARGNDPAGQRLLLALAEGTCADSMSGARQSYDATLTIGSETLSGCALEGRGAMTPMP